MDYTLIHPYATLYTIWHRNIPSPVISWARSL